MTSLLRLYAQASRTRALGPFIRHALWVQGCPFHCPGCMTPDARAFDTGEDIAVEALAEDILTRPDVEGLTVTGGEPFAQVAALAELVARVRARGNLGLIVYTGYQLDDLQQTARNDPDVRSLLDRVDLLVDGPYIETLNNGAALKGSANQRVIPLSARYMDQLHLYGTDRPREVELHMDVDVDMLVGVPSPGQLNWWRSNSQKTSSPIPQT
jgi:anaerobic ribonucleoside-triphosphate reductase activating protein